MSSKLAIYNYALGYLGEQSLTTETDPYTRRRELDTFYPAALAMALENGQWNFAMRSVQATADATPPAYGWQYRYTKPGDWVRTSAVSANEFYDPPLNEFVDESGYWMTNLEPVYFRYVSNDDVYGGMNLTKWPASFEQYASALLAQLSCLRITQDKGLLDRLVQIIVPRMQKLALSRDAMNGPSPRMPSGTWVGSRGTNISRERGIR